MNSIAQQAVPKGNGQKEKRCDQSSSFSKVVVSQLSPVVAVTAFMVLGTSLPPAASVALVTVRYKLRKSFMHRQLRTSNRGCRGGRTDRGRRRAGIHLGRQLDVALRRAAGESAVARGAHRLGGEAGLQVLLETRDPRHVILLEFRLRYADAGGGPASAPAPTFYAICRGALNAD